MLFEALVTHGAFESHALTWEWDAVFELKVGENMERQ